jgi:hypothetical protein
MPTLSTLPGELDQLVEELATPGGEACPRRSRLLHMPNLSGGPAEVVVRSWRAAPRAGAVGPRRPDQLSLIQATRSMLRLAASASTRARRASRDIRFMAAMILISLRRMPSVSWAVIHTSSAPSGSSL